MPPLDASTNRLRPRSRADVVQDLRRLLPRLERAAAETRALPFGVPALDSYLPQRGLAFGALHEVAPAGEADEPAAFGFVMALLGRVPVGPVCLVFSRRKPTRPHGHGLNSLGLDPARVILVEADGKQALWAMEEALRSAVPAVVVGALDVGLDLKISQRLHLAAGEAGRLLVLMRPARAGPSAAMTRWRVGSAAAARDRFGLIARWRWRVALERCRNGRPGEWLLEFDHAAHRFSLAPALADPALTCSAGTRA
jgi:protein ImuA